MQYQTIKKVSLKGNPDPFLSKESSVQNYIADNPAILGLGNLRHIESERVQKSGGRLDLLLASEDSNRWYEVELQLGKLDESHIIRCIEYWDLERKKRPNVSHVAVIIAEDITSRFLNVISLFNGHIPIIAYQLSAIETDGGIGLDFVKVLDEVDYSEVYTEEISEEVTRDFWLSKSSKEQLEHVDGLLKQIKDLYPDGNFELNYNKPYIGLKLNGAVFNFIKFLPKRKQLNLHFKIPNDTELKDKLDDTELNVLDYDRTFKYFRITLKKNELQQYSEIIVDLIKQAYEYKSKA